MGLMLAAGEAAPAGGAAMGEVIVATAIGAIATVCVLGPVILYRQGRFPLLERLSDFSGRVTGLPGWAALPLAIQGGALVTAVFGMYWDISIHIDDGRDEGPLANPAHWFILFGLMGVMAAGVFGMALPREKLRSSVRVPGVGDHAPAGAIIIAVCGAFSLTAFPLDDVWHRIFGQDVTLWSPTHLMLITGASLSTFGSLALYRESLEHRSDRIVPARAGWLLAPLAGAMLIGLNTFMAEFDFAVPQFRLDMHPIGLALAAGLTLVAARLVIGPYGALATVGFFLVVRGILYVLVGPVFGGIEPRFPLYVVEALLVELAAVAFLRRGAPIAQRPVIFGAVCGALIGTIGFAAEWGWTHVWFVHPWTESMLPEALISALLMATAAGTIGGFVGRALTLRSHRLAPAPYWALPAAAVVAVLVALVNIPISDGGGTTRASLELRDVAPRNGERHVETTARLEPADAADDARWLTMTSWQGKRKSVVQHMEATGEPGVYRSSEPVPVDGTWKTILRLHRDDEVLGVPVFLPEDPAIPAEEVPASARIDRAFVLDKKNLQREQKEGVSAWLTTAAYVGVGALIIPVFGVLFWALRRVRLELGHEGDPPAAAGPPFAPPDGVAPAT